MNFREIALSAFSGISRLYPKEYQQEYSEDLKSVFNDILEDPDGSGNWHAARSLLREFIYLPGCLIREYLSFPGEVPMKTTRQILGVTLLGFISLFSLLGIERIIFHFFLARNWIDQQGILLLELIIDGTASGILAGGAIGFALAVRNKAPMMAACGFGFVAGRLLTGPGYWDMLGIPTRWVNSDWQVLFMLAASPVTGLLVGGLAGLLWKGWKSGMIFSLVSSLIFTVGLLGQYVWILFFDYRMLHTVDPLSLSGNLRLFLGTLISYSILGAIAGVLWGILLDRLPRIRSIAWSSAGS
jgi:hypothetical protein